jgi:hypothetical protein
MVVNAKSKPLKGGFETQEGLNEVLRGTGLAYLLMGNNSVTLEKVAVAEPHSSQTMPAVNAVGKTIPGAKTRITTITRRLLQTADGEKSIGQLMFILTLAIFKNSRCRF